jgi:hypothetical protein
MNNPAFAQELDFIRQQSALLNNNNELKVPDHIMRSAASIRNMNDQRVPTFIENMNMGGSRISLINDTASTEGNSGKNDTVLKSSTLSVRNVAAMKNSTTNLRDLNEIKKQENYLNTLNREPSVLITRKLIIEDME